MEEKRDRVVFTASLMLAIIAALCIAGANLWFGNLNQDEGWYLYSARMVSQGKLPYRDFFFTQSPLLPSVYGALYPLWGPFGIAGGRFLTLIFGLGGSILAAWAVAAIVPKRVRMYAALTAFSLLSCNVYHSYFTTVVKTYGLACLLVSASALALTGIRGRLPYWSAALSGLLMACAAGTRLSLGAGLCVVGIYLLTLHKRSRQRLCWFWFGIGGILGLSVVFAPFVIPAFDAYRFALSFHGARGGAGIQPLYIAGFIARWASGYLVLFAALVGIAAARFAAGKSVEEDDVAIWPAWLGCAVLVSLIHIFSPYPYDDYQVPIMPLFAAVCSVLFWRRFSAGMPVPFRVWCSAALVVVVCVVSAASPLVKS